jgi:aminoglycoside phosphotransferase (APT) family kinase protein
LSQDRRDLYARFIDAAPRLVTRTRSRRNLTIVHGDAHVWNCFLPRDGGDDVRLFDWDSWHIAPATNDLAYMMAMHWYPDLRRQREQALLDHYHAALVANGVRDYDRRALDDDYRWSVLWLLRTPVWQAEFDIPPLIWWNNLGRILLAVDDLGCRDLLA